MIDFSHSYYHQVPAWLRWHRSIQVKDDFGSCITTLARCFIISILITDLLAFSKFTDMALDQSLVNMGAKLGFQRCGERQTRQKEENAR